MNHEWLMIAAMAVGSICFAVGGTGPKWVRRYIMPVLLGVIALIAGEVWHRCLGYTLTLMIAVHLGYGEKYPYWAKFLVGCAFVLPSLFFGFTWWQVITPIVFVGMFKISNMPFSSNSFVWKIVEFLTGGLIGVTLANLIK